MHQNAAYQPEMGFGFLVPLLVVSIPFAIGLYKVAGRIGKEKGLWAILSLIPILNYFFWVYAWFVVVLYVIDHLRDIEAAVVGARGEAGAGAQG